MIFINKIDNLLNNYTMYKLIMFVLTFLILISFSLSLLDFIPFKPLTLILSLTILISVCAVTNIVLSNFLKAPANIESQYITALILFFLLPPPNNLNQIMLTALTATIAMVSKYIFAWKHKHIFNPAAIAIVITGYSGLLSPIWWPTHPILVIATLISGTLIVRKIRKFQMIFTFLVISTLTLAFFTMINDRDLIKTVFRGFANSPRLFFATIMLTEPLTTPPTKTKQLTYASIIGFFYSFQLPIGPIYFSAELALIIGNLYSFAVSLKKKITLTLKDVKKEGANIFTYIFSPDYNFTFSPGQFLEWTAPQNNSDIKGNRRFFTIASSPTEEKIMLGVKLFNPSSSFKKYLKKMKNGDKIVAGQLAGDFTLPDNNNKLAWIAGGIGITPFRSQAKFLTDTNKKRDIKLLYTASTEDEFTYKDIFTKAKQIGLTTTYCITHENSAPKNWRGLSGRLTKEKIIKEIPDYNQRIFYLSGGISMVNSYKSLLKNMGVNSSKIVTDYFQGYA